MFHLNGLVEVLMCSPGNFPAFQLFYLFGVAIVCFMFVSASWSCMSNENSISCFHILINLCIYYMHVFIYIYIHVRACRGPFLIPFCFLGGLEPAVMFWILVAYLFTFGPLQDWIRDFAVYETHPLARTSTARASGTNVSKQLKRLRKTEAWSHHTYPWRSFCWTAWDFCHAKKSTKWLSVKFQKVRKHL